jgi:hypothetical protein
MPEASQPFLDLAMHARKAERRIEIGRDPGKLDHMPHAGAASRLDEIRLYFLHVGRCRGNQDGAVDAAECRGQRIGARHVAVDNFDMGEGGDHVRFRGIAHQRAGGDAPCRKQAQQRRAMLSGRACHQDHVRLLPLCRSASASIWR